MKVAIKEVKRAVKFFNSTKKDFSCMWDSVPYTLKAGSTTMLPEYLAQHFAKHLAVRELNSIGGKKGIVNTQNLPPMMAKFLITSDIEGNSDTELQIEMMNQKEVQEQEKASLCDDCESKGTRHKKDCPIVVAKQKELDEEEKAETASSEASFEGLKE